MRILATIREWTHAVYWVVPRSDKPRPDHYIQIGAPCCDLKVDTPAAARSLEAAARACAEAMEAEQATEHAAEKPIHDSDRDQRPDPKAAE